MRRVFLRESPTCLGKQGDLPRFSPSFIKVREFFIPLTEARLRGVKRRNKWISQYLLLFFTVIAISACLSTETNQSQPINSQATPADCRVVQHALGETCIPVNPQRVVVLSIGLDTILSLGVKPVGSVQVGRKDYLESKAEGVASVGSPGNPDLESIVALNPDLILGIGRHKESYKLLSQIAPTFIAEVKSSVEWKKLLIKYAEALGKTETAEQIMSNYDARIEEFQSQMGERLSETETSIIRVRQDRIEIYLEDSFPGAVVADTGLPRPSEQTNAEQEFDIDISKESLYMAEGDVMYVWTSGSNEEIAEDDQAALEELKVDPLWSELNAVQQGQVYDIPQYWIGTGPIAANLVLDDLFKYLVDSPSQSSQ